MASNSMTVNLSDKSALVTGASSGIGAAVASALAANGAMVWVNHPDEATAEAAEAVVASIVEAGGAAQAIQADVSLEADVLKMFASTCLSTPSFCPSSIPSATPSIDMARTRLLLSLAA